jgi:serine/threonine protein phosphatase PrpC
LEIQFFAATDVGRQREHNEDNYLIDPKLHLFVVADGMGGHAAGEVASQIAVHELCRSVREHRDVIERFPRAGASDGDLSAMRTEVSSMLERAVQQACATIYRASQEDPRKRGMATTCCALLLVGDRGFIAHVGDSRIYLVRGGQVHQITEDHSLINELVKRGKIKRDEVEKSPYAKYKNAVTRAVGAHETVEADTLDFDVLPGDQFLLCSDGMYAYLKETELPELLSSEDVAEVPRHLVAIANEGGGHDNITAVVVRVAEKATKEAVARASDLANKVDVLRGMPLFKHLTYKEIIRILNITTVRDFMAGEPVIVEGTPGDELFVILGGKVRLHKSEALITYLERGAHVGEMALVDRSPRSASVTAEEQTRVLILRRREFYEIIRKEPPLATKLLWSFVQVLTERLRKTTAELSGARLEAQAEDLSDAVFDDDPNVG